MLAVKECQILHWVVHRGTRDELWVYPKLWVFCVLRWQPPGLKLIEGYNGQPLPLDVYPSAVCRVGTPTYGSLPGATKNAQRMNR